MHVAFTMYMTKGLRWLPCVSITYYESVCNSKKDSIVKVISPNSGFSEVYISKVYDYVFKNEYDLYRGKKRFDADYDMAESFRRLREGKTYRSMTLFYLNMSIWNMI